MSNEHQPQGKFARNKQLNTIFQYFDEREDAILVKRPATGEPVWSPKHIWDFDLEKKPEIIRPDESLVLKARIIDRDRYWTFSITLQEYDAWMAGDLILYWNKGFGLTKRAIEEQIEQLRHDRKKGWYDWEVRVDKDTKARIKVETGKLKDLRDANVPLHLISKQARKYDLETQDLIRRTRKNLKRRSYRGWCLVNKKQFGLLQDNINYTPERLMQEGGIELLSTWSSIVWLKEQQWREFKVVKRRAVTRDDIKALRRRHD